MLVWYRPQQMYAVVCAVCVTCQVVLLYIIMAFSGKMKIVMQKLSRTLIVNHITKSISVTLRFF